MSSRSVLRLVATVMMCLPICPLLEAAFPDTEVFLPSVGKGEGAAGSQWTTTLWIHNPCISPANVQVFLLLRDQANPAPAVYNTTVPPGDTLHFADAMNSMFGQGGFGALRVVSDSKIAVNARIHSVKTGESVADSVGQFFSAVPSPFAITLGEATEVLGVHQTSPAASSDYRYNFGFVETAGETVTVRVTARDGLGTVLGSKDYALAGYEPRQHNIADLLPGIDHSNVRLTAEVVSGDGAVVVFGSGLANVSSDPSTFEMLFADDLLAGSTGAVSTDTTLTGDGTTGSPLGIADGGVSKAKLAPTGGTSGQVLSTDGIALEWRDAGSLTLPFEGSGSNPNGGALRVNNTATSITSYGVEGYGRGAGGFFADTDSDGFAYIGWQNWGVNASGAVGGGYFEDTNSSGRAWVAYGDVGLQASGSSGGGFFSSSSGTGYALVGPEYYGIDARGTSGGGHFQSSTGSAETTVAKLDTGISASGSVQGGYFYSTNGSGIEATGGYEGGTFRNIDGSASTSLARSALGLTAWGDTMGGFFADGDDSGRASLGFGDYGAHATGHSAGGFFEDSNGSGWAKAGADDTGVWAKGDYAGGSFGDLDSGVWGDVAHGAASTMGNGSKSFIQNHPHESDRVIVYASLEGDEVGTYTRGTARLTNGEARIRLGETFKWVTNPDLGLTAHVTPRGRAVPLAVASVTTEELVVRGPANSDEEVLFDYVVYGLRIGFDEASAVREKEREAYLPSMAEIHDLYARRPELRRFSPRARFEAMRRAAGQTVPPDLTASNALRDAIGGFDNENLAITRMATRQADDAPRPPAASVQPVSSERRAVATPLGIPQTSPPQALGHGQPARTRLIGDMLHGTVVLDPRGEAWVDVPPGFAEEHESFHYQLTCIGGFAPLYVADEIQAGRFRIAGGDAGMKVSWQVLGVS